ncbi:MAG: DMT family transporter, partial [Gammaproteobacteria bacterium]|nr:DMT family transporter [Gammaproteobacteria bacterium]
MHTTSGHWRLGALLALTTAIMWGVLPIALKFTLQQMDAVTITWYRFVAATLILGAILAHRGRFPRLAALNARGWGLLLIAILGLCGNYVLYLLGLDHVTPGTAQIVVQLAPILLLTGALVLFRERFSILQWTGLLIFISGQALFFNRDLAQLLTGGGAQSTGVWLVVASAVVWAAYALAQKQLLNVLGSDGILFCVYVAAVFMFYPASEPAQILHIDGFTLSMLVFASINTLIAYGAFAEALEHIEASRVSAIIALAPLLTLAAMVLLGAVFPGFTLEEPLDALKIGGAVLVVTGSIM